MELEIDLSFTSAASPPLRAEQTFLDRTTLSARMRFGMSTR